MFAALMFAALMLGCGAKTGAVVHERPPCESDLDCDDGIHCDGLETCQEGRCRRGTPPTCDDGDVCTVDLCVEATASCEHGPREVADVDRDGFFVVGLCGDDCDDADPSVYPGATELCNGGDDDCDGRIDEGASYEPEGAATRLSFGPEVSGRGAPAWSPRTATFGVTYWEYQGGTANLLFQQLGPDGRPIAPPKVLTPGRADAFGADLVWNDDEGQYALVWQDRRDGVWEVYFNRLTPDGEKLAPDLRVTVTPHWSVNPTLLWTGGEYVVAWQDWRHEITAPENFEIYATFIDRDGFEIGDDIRLTFEDHGSEAPVLALGEGEIGVAFVDGRTGTEQVWAMVVDLLGRPLTEPQQVSAAAGDAFAPDMVWLGDAFVLTWQEETPAGDFDIVGARIERPGARVDGPFPVATGEAWARSPRLLPGGDGALVVYSDDRRGVYDLYAAVYDSHFVRLGADIALTASGRDSAYGAIARGGTAVGVLFEDQRDGNWEVYFTRLLCAGLPAGP